MKIVPQKVEYVDHMGSDLNVVNAARVSFHKIADEFTHKDEKLIAYLAKHNHWTPFAHTSVSLRIKAPIFVARQLVKHQIGLVWNEVSRRYVDEPPEFYMPDVLRARAENVKQGSADHEVQGNGAYLQAANYYTGVMAQMYEGMIHGGVAPEQARMFLPQNMMTEWIWTGSVAAWARVCNLRLDPHTQQETREVAQMIKEVVEPLYPVSFKALLND
jgi:thymidylate synthase (FAD)